MPDILPNWHQNLPENSPTEALRNPCRNIAKLLEKTGAGEGIRTLDPNLGKVVLYP